MKFRQLLTNDQRRREMTEIRNENLKLLKRLQEARPTVPKKAFDDEYERHAKIMRRMHVLKYGEYNIYIYIY